MKNVIVAFCLVFCWTAVPAFAAPLTLKTESEVKGTSIRLSDVFGGLPEGTDRDIALAPAPAKSVTYDVRVLARLAHAYQLDWRPQSVGDHVVLTRASTRITPEMIKEAALVKLRGEQVKDAAEAEVVFDSRFVGFALAAEASPNFTWENFSYDAQARRFRGDVVAGEGANAARQTVSGRLLVKREVPVLAHRLAVGAVVGERDLVWQSLPQESLAVDVLTDMASIVGQEMRRDQAEGEVLRARDLIAPRLVTRGGLVTLKVETPLMQITVQGRALQDGARGETVRVTNVQSNKIVEGVVEASGVVRAGSPARLASAQ